MKKQNFVSESEKGGAPRLWGAPPFFGSRRKRRLTPLARSAQSVHRGEAAAAHPAFFAGAVRAQPFPALRAAVRRRRVQGLPAPPAKISVHGNPSRKQVCSLFPRIMLFHAGAVSAVRRTYSQTKQAIGLRNMGQGALPLAGVGSAHEKKTIAAGNQTPKAHSFPI